MRITSDDYFNVLMLAIVFVLVIAFSYGFTKATHIYFIKETVKQECLK